MSQLLLALEADIFVGPRDSHWIKLLDELRKVNGKAKAPLLLVHE
jgi:hypothetical protein